MKTLARSLFVGSNNIVTGVIALAVVLSIALGCNCNKDLANLGKEDTPSNTAANTKTETTSSSEVPSNSVVEGLVKDTISQFADAVDSGNFADLHSKASTDFQSSYTVDQMATAFKSYTDKKRVVVPILEKADDMDAKFKADPSLRSEKGLKILMAEGEFATKPAKTRFDFEYVNRGGEWKLLKLVINIP